MNYTDIIKNQPTTIIGCIGHVASGKSTFTKNITGIKTQRHSSEQEKNITIDIGYANVKIFIDKNNKLHTARSDVMEMEDMELIGHYSFLDCPGHHSFMANMMSGSALMDACVLVIASNEHIPQPQTREHLNVVEKIGIKNYIILQNKMDLIQDFENTNKKSLIDSFILNTSIENSRIIPTSIQNGINNQEILKSLINFPHFERPINEPPKMLIIRSFDVNKAHKSYNDMVGGIVGGSLISGYLSLGDYIEIRPGFIIKKDEQVTFRPILSNIVSLQSDTNKLEKAFPGGLIGIGLNIDPSMTKSNRMIGNTLGLIGTLPKVYQIITLCIDNTNTKFKVSESIKLNINSMVLMAKIKKIKKKKLYIELEKPVCTEIYQIIPIFRFERGNWILVINATIISGIEIEMDTSEIETYEMIKELNIKNNIEIIDDRNKLSLIDLLTYEQLIENVNFKTDTQNIFNIIPPIVNVVNRDTIISNFSELCNCIYFKNEESIQENIYKQLLLDFIKRELSCDCNLNNQNQLLIKGKYKQSKIELAIKQFIVKYLKCISCSSCKSYLIKQNRNFHRICINCKSQSCI